MSGSVSTAPDLRDACSEHIPALYTLAMRLTRNPRDAEDLVQDVLVVALEAPPPTLHGGGLKGWLFRVLTNRFLDNYRKRQRHKAAATELQADPQQAPDAGQVLTQAELCDEILHALDQLAPEYRQVVEAVDLGGASYRAAADALGLPGGTLMSRLYRARKLLRVALAELARDEWGIT